MGKINIFISYCHENNLQHEVDHLNNALYHSVRTATAFDIKIFQDTRSLRTGDKFNEVIKEEITKSSIFIAVISPSYFKSEYCMRELKEYLKLIKGKNNTKLLLPVYFIDIKDDIIKSENFSKESQILHKRVLKFNYDDWRDIRKSCLKSKKYSSAITSLSNRISEHITKNALRLKKQIINENSPLEAILEAITPFLPPAEAPSILICGKCGNGKTTTINTLFGSREGNIGHYDVGTKEAEYHSWQYKNKQLCLIDLPGLGVGTEEDKIFIKSYRPWLTPKNGKFPVHAILIVVAFPRLGEGTWDTLRFILKKGFPPNCIIFGINKLGELTYHARKNDLHDTNIEFDIETGLTPHSQKIVDTIKEKFLKDLNEKFPECKFKLNQCIEYDSRGWNIHNLLMKLINVMPYYTLNYLEKETINSRKLLKEQAKSEEKKIKLEQEDQRLTQSVTSLILDGISTTLHFNNPSLGKIFDKFRSVTNNVVNSTKALGTRIKNFFFN